VAVKAARFRPRIKCPGLCSSAPPVSCGQLVTAPLFRLGLETGIEAAMEAGSQIERINIMTSNTKTRPTHRIYAVTKSGDTKFWQPIGALWAHADGKGFNQRIDYLPLNDAELVIRVAGDKEAEGKGGAQ
jgi:hypothetical protein